MLTIDGKTVQQVIAYAAVVMGILTQALSGIHLPAIASAILGVFGILLHPQTSVNATAQASSPGTKSLGVPTQQGSGTGTAVQAGQTVAGL